MEALRAERDLKDKKITELLKEMNIMSNNILDLKTENSYFRNHSHVPDNFGIEIESIKMHEKEKIEDFKKLIRVL
jgi:hypothetical protein